MMESKFFLFFLMLFLPILSKSQSIYQSSRGSVEFYSETASTKISGKNENLITKLDSKSGLVSLEIKMGEFEFQDRFVEYQFN